MEIRLFRRCIQLARLPKSRYRPLQGFLRGGQCTAWPWWQFRIGRIELSVSRIRPLPDTRES